MATPRNRSTTTRAAKAIKAVPDHTVELWDEYVQDAEPDVEPWQKQLPDGTLLTVACPSSEAVDALGEAQAVGDVQSMIKAMFGDDADTIIELTKKKSFTLRVKMINDVMLHYGMSLNRLPESEASSD